MDGRGSSAYDPDFKHLVENTPMETDTVTETVDVIMTLTDYEKLEAEEDADIEEARPPQENVEVCRATIQC